jgi:hypothetical protein
MNRSRDEQDGEAYRKRDDRYTATGDQHHHAGRADDDCRNHPDAETREERLRELARRVLVTTSHRGVACFKCLAGPNGPYTGQPGRRAGNWSGSRYESTERLVDKGQ